MFETTESLWGTPGTNRILYVNYASIKKTSLKMICFRERRCVCARGRGQQERERESQADSMPSGELDAGPRFHYPAVTTWAKTKNWMVNWLCHSGTQLFKKNFKSCFVFFSLKSGNPTLTGLLSSNLWMFQSFLQIQARVIFLKHRWEYVTELTGIIWRLHAD